MLLGLGNKQKTQQQPSKNESIIDATDADFENAVLKESLNRPVLVDFWAPWCGPCKQLTPTLEQSVTKAGGKVLLAKVNVDENPQLAAAFRVQSIPTVIALYAGQPVSGFTGARPASDIDNLIAQLVKLHQQNQPQAIDIPAILKEAAAALETNDLDQAQALYAAILTQDKTNVDAYVGIIRVFIAGGNVDEAAQLVADAPPEMIKHPNFAAATTALDLARQTGAMGAADGLARAVDAKPDDPALRHDLAMAYFAEGRKEDATNTLITLIKQHKGWEDDKARKTLLRFFEAWGPADGATRDGRRKLSALLFS